MLETLSICWYSSLGQPGGSENPTVQSISRKGRPMSSIFLDGAGAGILRDFTPGSLFGEMIKSELHGDMQE